MTMDPHGFFWREGDYYHVIILHPERRVWETTPKKRGRSKKAFTKQYKALTPEHLIELCRADDDEIGYEIGTPEKVKELCESAPCYR